MIFSDILRNQQREKLHAHWVVKTFFCSLNPNAGNKEKPG
jgi:hypothetical protein